MLNFDSRWRFESPGPIPIGVVNKFSDFNERIAAQGNRWTIIEHFKSYFAGAAGSTSSWSSSESWANSDLSRYMDQASENSPMFVEAFFDACNSLQKLHPNFGLPEIGMINRVLSENDAGCEISPPDLLFGMSQERIAVPERHASLDEQAQELIQGSLKESERLLAEGRNRPAVAEILWLLETVSTAFRGLDIGTGTIGGKYFNRIVSDLRKHHKGQTLDQFLNWVTTLHGYLSSPTGGGIRHGADIASAVDMKASEAQLFCNLTRSYITFLMVEHSRLSKGRSAF